MHTGQHSLASGTTGPQMVRSHLADRKDSNKHHCLGHTRLLGQPLKSLGSRPQYAHSAKWVPFCFLKAPSKSSPRPAGFIVSDFFPVPELLCLINLLLQLFATLPPHLITQRPRGQPPVSSTLSAEEVRATLISHRLGRRTCFLPLCSCMLEISPNAF